MARTGGTSRKSTSLKGQVSDAEWQTRQNLAAGCRVAQHLGWNDTIRNHFTARVPDESDKFLMNPVGLMWSEITASDFLKVDFKGKCHTPSDFRPGPAGLVFHGAILERHPNLHCSFHLHPSDGVVVSAMEDGLIFAYQESLALYGQVATYEFESYPDDPEDGIRVAQRLGDKTCMIMGNHGLLTVGRTIAEGFYNMARLIDACTIQIKLMASGAKIKHIPKSICELTYRKHLERANARPIGQEDWAGYYRLAERLYPEFKN